MASNSDIDALLRHLGDIGPYQIKVYILSCLPVFIAGAITTALVFTTAIPNHRQVCHFTNCLYPSQLNAFLHCLNLTGVLFVDAILDPPTTVRL